MAINFPSNAAPNDLYTYLTHTWIWNGKGWQLDPAAYIGSGFTLTYPTSIVIKTTTNLVPLTIVSFKKAP